MTKIGVLGFAHGHVSMLLREWRIHPEYGVCAVSGWDGDAARRQKSCTDHALREETSAEALLSADDTDAVIIGAETAYHAALCTLAADAGKKIILYKPMALTLAQADAIVEATERGGVPFTVAWQMRTDPANLEIAETLRGGTLGKCFYFRRRHCLSTHLWDGFASTWHNTPSLNRDIFADDIAHPLDLLHSLFGMPASVTCEMTTARSPLVPNDTGVAVLRYPDGMLAEVAFCAVCTAAEITSEAYFEKGALQHYGGDGPATQLPHEGAPALKWFRAGDSDWTVSPLPLPSGQSERIAGQAKPLADFLNEKRPPICTAAEARDSLRLVLACYLSAREGRRVCPDDPALYGV